MSRHNTRPTGQRNPLTILTATRTIGLLPVLAVVAALAGFQAQPCHAGQDYGATLHAMRGLLEQISALLDRLIAQTPSAAIPRNIHEPSPAPVRPRWHLYGPAKSGQRLSRAARGLVDPRYDAKLLRNRDDALKAGLLAFRSGRYDRAADFFLLACELDCGDPASRLHAAQALFALGQFRDAVSLVRRAFELQPKLVWLKFDLRSDYGNPRDFESQVQRLRTCLRRRPKWADGWLLLGYQLLYSGRRAEAHEAFSKAAALNPADTLARRFLRASLPLRYRNRTDRSKPAGTGQTSLKM